MRHTPGQKASDTHRKKCIWKGILNVYRKAVSDVRKLLKRDKDIHFYEYEHGFLKSPGLLGIDSGKPLTPEELLLWVYENGILDKGYSGKKNPPFSYTDDEIEEITKDVGAFKIERLKDSIRFHLEAVSKHREEIRRLEGKP